MSIHFAPAKSTAIAPVISPNARVLFVRARAKAANDNADFSTKSAHGERVLRAALRHFADHGLGAAKVARAQAEKAFFQGDRETYDWWVGITRTLDRRLAEELSGRNVKR